jgi:Zn-dependent M16 (insulinase) family peptidase
MRINGLNLNLNASKQSTSDLFSLLRINREITRINEKKQALVLINSQLILTLRINNKYIIIIYLGGLFSLYRTHCLYFGRKRLE